MKKMPRTLYLCIFLLILGIIAGGILAGINELTAPIIAENAEKELAKNLAKVGVTEPKEITDSTNTNKTVIAVYTGKYENADCYVMNTADTNKYTTVNVLVVLSKADGQILNLNISGTPNITTHGFDASFTNEALGVVGSTDTNSFTPVTGATISSTSVKTCIDEALKIYLTLDKGSTDVEEDPNKAMDELLAKANVTDGQKVEMTYEDGSSVVNTYEGKYNETDCYVFETSKQVTIEEYYVNFALKSLIVVSKADGSILNIVVTSKFYSSNNIQATDFGMIGQTNVDSFVSVSGATYSSNAVKACIEEALTIYNTLKGGAE